MGGERFPFGEQVLDDFVEEGEVVVDAEGGVWRSQGLSPGGYRLVEQGRLRRPGYNM